MIKCTINKFNKQLRIFKCINIMITYLQSIEYGKMDSYISIGNKK